MRRYLALLLFFALPITIVLNNCTTSSKVYYHMVEQKPTQLFSDSALLDNPQNYDIYIFSKGKVYKTTDIRRKGDSLILRTFQLDSITAENVKSKPIKKRSHLVEIFVNDSLATKDTLSGEIAIQKSDVVIVRRYAANGGQQEPNAMSSDQKISIVAVTFVALVLLGALVLGYVLLISLSGCFIATLVYKSHDAPQVLTLRKYRDEYLLKSFHGKLFVAWYYSWSPLFTKIFAHVGVHKLIRFFLDKIVRRLEERESKKNLVSAEV